MRKDNSYATRKSAERKRLHEPLSVAWKAQGYSAFYQISLIRDLLIAVVAVIGAVLAGFIKADSVDTVVIGFSYAAIVFFIVCFMVFVYGIAFCNKKYVNAMVTDNEEETERYSKKLKVFDSINNICFLLGLSWLLVAFILY